MLASLKRSIQRLVSGPEESAPASTAPTVGRFDAVDRLQDRYPQLASIAFNLSIRSPEHTVEPTLNGRGLGPDARAYFVFKCKNVECVGGDFDLTDVVEEIVAKRCKELSGRRVCQGWESPKFVHQRRCLYELNFKVIAEFDD